MNGTDAPRRRWRLKHLGTRSLRLDVRASLDRNRLRQLVNDFGSALGPLQWFTRMRAELDRGAISYQSYCALLRWSITDGSAYTGTAHIATHQAAQALWIFLFGAPIPTWRQWDNDERKHVNDERALQRWLESVAELDLIE